jgi:hypothetical protein
MLNKQETDAFQANWLVRQTLLIPGLLAGDWRDRTKSAYNIRINRPHLVATSVGVVPRNTKVVSSTGDEHMTHSLI